MTHHQQIQRHGRIAACFTLGITCLVGTAAAHTTPSAPLRIEDALTEVHVADATLSPDGTLLAYVACRSRPLADDVIYLPSGFYRSHAGCTLHLLTVATGTAIDMGLGDHVGVSPAWAPDGQTLAFYADLDGIARIWTYHVATRARRRVSDAVIRFLDMRREQGLQYSPDGRQLLAKVLPEGLTLADATRTIATYLLGAAAVQPGKPTPRYLSAGSHQENAHQTTTGTDHVDYLRSAYFRGDLALVDVTSGAVRRLTRDTNPSWYRFSPDGTRIAYQDWRGRRADAEYGQVMDVVMLETDTGRVIAQRHLPNVSRFEQVRTSWSPSSHWFTFADCQFLTRAGDELDLRATDATAKRPCGTAWAADDDVLYTTEPTAAAETKIWQTVPRTRAARLVGTVAGRNGQLVVSRALDRAWLADGDSLRVLSQHADTARLLITSVNVTTGQTAVLADRPNYVPPTNEVAVRDIAADGRFALLDLEGTGDPGELWRMSPAAALEPITTTNRHLRAYRFGAVKPLEWRSTKDGRPLRGALLLPPDYDASRRYPLFVWVYGVAPLSRDAYKFGGASRLVFNLQLLATRGYAVLLPDSYIDVGTPMTTIAAAVLPGIDRAIDTGVADPDRVAIAGHSFGAYSTLSLLVQTQRFCAAAGISGVYDLWRNYGGLQASGADDDGTTNIESWLGGTPWTHRTRYLENSPTAYLDRVTTPLLIVHGGRDVVPSTGADALFSALRRLGKTTDYVFYPNEMHVFFDPANQHDFLDRALAWFETHCTPQPPHGSAAPQSSNEPSDRASRRATTAAK